MPKRGSERDDTLAADERAAGTRLESDLKRYQGARPAPGEQKSGTRGQKKAEGDIAKDALTGGDKLTKGRPPREPR
ncbi:MAG: hypothetical protein JWM77_2314 [Rhodospirillales bacterium]|nr:hypothetical protein [Rhodospirillales bacterium]